MQLQEWLSKNNKDQGDLARIIKAGGEITNRDWIRASRIFNGAMPNKEEMPKIYAETRGEVTANDFYGLNGHKPNSKRKRQ